jgi:hypothetical protein
MTLTEALAEVDRLTEALRLAEVKIADRVEADGLSALHAARLAEGKQ